MTMCRECLALNAAREQEAEPRHLRREEGTIKTGGVMQPSGQRSVEMKFKPYVCTACGTRWQGFEQEGHFVQWESSRR